MKKKFYKYHGAGNDFVIFAEDVFIGMTPSVTREEIRFLCHRRFGVGADGVLLLKTTTEKSIAFEMVYFNSDGSQGSFCGNGSRCISNLALVLGWVLPGEEFDFLFNGKIYRGFSPDGTSISVNLVDVISFGEFDKGFIADTGSPHLILESKETNWKVLRKTAEEIRYSPQFRADGINVNFLSGIEAPIVDIVTYERGVEDITYACGTGAVACAVYLAEKRGVGGKFRFRSAGGILSVSLNKRGSDRYENVWLSGPAERVFESEWTFGESHPVFKLDKAANNSL